MKVLQNVAIPALVSQWCESIASRCSGELVFAFLGGDLSSILGRDIHL
jgi:hypothetical protein